MGLGDGLIALVLSNNLRLNGAQVTTFHPSLQGLQAWFPHLPIQPFPYEQDLDKALADFDQFFLIYEKTSWMQAVLSYCQNRFPEKTTVLNPIATMKRDYPYWETGKFQGNWTFVDNLVQFCRDSLSLKNTTRDNGIHPPSDVVLRRFPKRVIIHPTSSRPGKNWPEAKFVALSKKLQAQGWEPVFALTKDERATWDIKQVEAPQIHSLTELTTLVAESGAMIGNDSGIGHLASCLGLPTLTICRNSMVAKFWRPAWAQGVVVSPYLWIPNVKGLRLRDQHWKRWITTRRVLNQFVQLSQLQN